MILTLVACKANYEWATDKLPKPSSRKGEVLGGDDSFTANIECSAKYYQQYIDECRNYGFNAEEYSSSEGITYLYNANGSTLTLSYYYDSYYNDSYMQIDLRAPLTVYETEWPNNAAAEQIPKPKSDLIGKNNAFSEDSQFPVYVRNTSYSDFNDYIKQCMDAGFNDISWNDSIGFTASNGKYDLSVSYVAVNVMRVSVSPI